MVKSHEGTEDPTEINALAILGADPDVRDIAALESMRTMATFAVQARRMTVKQRAKRLRKLQSGEVVTLGEIIDSQQKRAGFELDTEPRDTDLWKPCAGCGQPIERGHTRCDGCEQPLCAGGCGEHGPRGCMSPSRVAGRHGRPWRCWECAAASKTPEQRSEATRKGNATKTPEQRREAARKAKATGTPEQRSAAARKGNAARTPEQRREAARKGNATKTPEQRREASRRANAAQTTEQKSAHGREGNAVRWAQRAPQ